MELLNIIKSIIEEKKYDSLKKNINKIKSDELVKLRSHIVNEALKLRINALEKFYEIKNVNMKLPEKYRNLFFDKLFELKNNEINIPPEFVNEAASILNLEDELYLFDKSDLLNIFSTKDLNQNNIFNIIKYIVYNSFEDELYNRNDYILENVDYLSKKNEDNNKMFYPIIILDDECKHNIIYLLTYYYNLIESEIDVELTKFVIGNFSDQYRLYRNNLHKVKIEYPGLQISENEMVCPLFEKLINLEAQLINKSILRYDILEFAQLRIKKQSSKELLLHFFEWEEILMIENEIENVILTLQKNEFKEKYGQEKRNSDEFSRNNKILQKDNELYSKDTKNKLRKIGDGWEVTFNGEKKILKDLQGIFYIALCLQLPNRSFKYNDILNVNKMMYESENNPIKSDYISHRKNLIELKKEYTRIAKEFDINPVYYEYELGKIGEKIKKEKNKLMSLMLKGGIEQRASSKISKSFSKNYLTAMKNIQIKHPKFYEHLSHIKKGSGIIRYEGEIDWVVDLERKDI